MNQSEFQRLPGLLMAAQVRALGYSRSALEKLVDCGVLDRVVLRGCRQGRYQKRQLALLLGWAGVVDGDRAEFVREPELLRLKAVRRWTGLSEATVRKVADGNPKAEIQNPKALGLRLVRPPGSGEGKYLKSEVGRILGF